MTMPRSYCNLLVNSTVLNFVDKSLSLNCEQIQHDDDSSKDGVYTIYPSGVPLEVYCDFTSVGGGWTVRKHVYIILCVLIVVLSM